MEFSALVFFLSSSPAADDDTFRFFWSRFFFFIFLSSGSVSELELVDEDEDEVEPVLDELLSESVLELEELLDGLRFFFDPATTTASASHRLNSTTQSSSQ